MDHSPGIHFSCLSKHEAILLGKHHFFDVGLVLVMVVFVAVFLWAATMALRAFFFYVAVTIAFTMGAKVFVI